LFKVEENVCSEGEIQTAFTMLRHFIKPLVHSLRLGIPQALLDLAKGNDDGSGHGEKEGKGNGAKRMEKDKKNNGGKPPQSPSWGQDSSHPLRQEEKEEVNSNQSKKS
jgi:hypothetical protein